MTEPDNGPHIVDRNGLRAFVNGRACSDTLLHVLDRAFGHPRPEEERAAMPFAGGIMQHGYQCGMIPGATLAAGAQAHRLFGGRSAR